MNFRFLLLFSVIGLLSVSRVSATAQVSDMLIINGESFMLFACPLESHPVGFTTEMLFGETDCFTTGCWRGYIATWSIENDSLFLIKIKNDCCSKEGKLDEADLSQLFPEKHRNGKVFADWVTQNLLSPRGELLFYVHSGFSSSYEKEIEYVIKNGILQDIRTYDNSKCKGSQSATQEKEFQEVFKNEVYRRIDWSQIPDLGDKKIRVIVGFTTNEDGIVDSIRVVRSDNDDVLYQQIASNAICGIGGFPVQFKKGKLVQIMYSMPVFFSSENKEKYAQRY